MGFKIVELVLASAVADDGTVTGIAYPSGTNQAFFTGDNASATGVAVINGNDVYSEADSEIDITYGASTITLTNTSEVSWPAGSDVILQLAYATALELAEAGQITATGEEINKAADIDARQRAVTATADGLTTGILTVADRWINITSAAAGDIVKLPAAGAEYIGLVIEGWVGANGCEMRCDGTACTINGLDCKTTNEAAIPATHRVRATLVAAETWLLEGDTELGARVTIVPDPV